MSARRILLTTLPYVTHTGAIREMGLLTASTVKTKHIGTHLMGEITTFFGGKLSGYSDLLMESRREVTDDLIRQADRIGADAVIGVRYQSSNIVAGATEIMVYGTAIKYTDSPIDTKYKY